MKNILNILKIMVGQVNPLVSSYGTLGHSGIRAMSTGAYVSRRTKKPTPFWSIFPWDSRLPLLLTSFTVSTILNQFIEFLVNKEVTTSVIVQIFVKFEDGSTRSMCKIQSIFIEPQNAQHQDMLRKKLFNIVWGACDAHTDNYVDLTIVDAGLKYKILDTRHVLNFKETEFDVVLNSDIKEMRLPNTMDIPLWPALLGGALDKINKVTDNVYNFNIDDKLYNIILTQDALECIISVHGSEILRFKDTLLYPRLGASGLQCFIRDCKGVKYHFEDGKLIEKTRSFEDLYIGPIKPLKKSDNYAGILNNHIAMDLETRTEDGKVTVVAAAWYHEVLNKAGTGLLPKSKSYVWLEYGQDEDKMLRAMFLDLQKIVRSRERSLNVIVHNLSGFDGIFLMKIFSGLNAQIIKNDQKLISISVPVENSKGKVIGSLVFKDSLQMLPVSLNALAAVFGTFPKDHFNFELFDKVSASKSGLALTLLGSPLLEDLKRYNKKDCIILYKVWHDFQILIYNVFGLNINIFSTLSGLAFGIFRAKFLKDKNIKINVTTNEIDKTIRPGYTGGHVDIYKPHGFNLWKYDINSLYPYVMKNFELPSGKCLFFEGDRDLKDLYGIVFAEIIAPTTGPCLDIPILLVKGKITNGKTIAPLGSWRGWYFTEELKFAVEQGYKVKVLKGYLYEKANLFDTYVDFLYDLRLQYSKDDPMNLICKLLLNGLSGRFGLKLNLEKNKFVMIEGISAKDLTEMEDLLDFGNGYGLMSHKDPKNLNLSDTFTPTLVSLPVSMAIASLARIIINKIKLEYKDNLFYSDTDSLVLDCPLREDLVSSSELGKFKFEGIIEEGIFLGPKFYALKMSDGTEVSKIKGFKLKVEFDQMKTLLVEGASLELEQFNWYRRPESSAVFIKEVGYTASVNSTKRQMLYIDGILQGTKPVSINLLPVSNQ